MSFLKPTGRITRRKYLIFFLVFFFTNLFALLKMYEAIQVASWISFISYGILLVVTIIVLLIQSAKRLHDIGYPGKLALYLLIPPPINFIGFIWLSYKDGEVGDNKYGEDPRKTDILT